MIEVVTVHHENIEADTEMDLKWMDGEEVVMVIHVMTEGDTEVDTKVDMEEMTGEKEVAMVIHEMREVGMGVGIETMGVGTKGTVGEEGTMFTVMTEAVGSVTVTQPREGPEHYHSKAPATEIMKLLPKRKLQGGGDAEVAEAAGAEKMTMPLPALTKHHHRHQGSAAAAEEAATEEISDSTLLLPKIRGTGKSSEHNNAKVLR